MIEKTIKKSVTLFTTTGLASLFLFLGQPMQSVNAASFNLDFETAPDGTPINPFALDGDGQTIDGTLYSTTLGNVGDIWNSIGLTITASNTTAPVGFFQTNCQPIIDALLAEAQEIHNESLSGWLFS